MEDFSNPANVPLFKKMDKALFERIDSFKVTPSYNNIQDFYNTLDEEQQKVFKAGVLLVIFLIPFIILSFLWWQNNSLKNDLQTRISLISKANEIIGQKQGLKDIGPQVMSQNPIDGESMMSSRLSNVLSAAGIDLSKIQVNNYKGEMASDSIMRAEADFKFTNISTDEMVNVFTNMIQQEKFRIQQLNVTRNADTNLLTGQFHAIHLGSSLTKEEE
jgi:hypothetical protein